MIFDAHCHAWERWPYRTSVPDPRTHASTTTLLRRMDENGVGRALIVAANTGGPGAATDNAHNNRYVRASAAEHPSRLSWVADVDSRWSPFYHTSGAADRLEQESAGAQGFTHYVRGTDDGWFSDADGHAFFERAVKLGLVASLHAKPPWFHSLNELAAQHPELPILLHHQGHAESDDELSLLAQLSRRSNVFVNISGFRYVSSLSYPYTDAVERLPRIVDAFGPGRLLWGSDAPVSTQQISYRATIDLVRSGLSYLEADDVARIMGGNLGRLLGTGALA
ncbi:amidohydrolase family protein [Microbacterium sp. NPDC076911]|uniref:amidohydrolase family protein n=1 Tax=Microbacterium sp. NPDC076911 TaxID=3154958 RepID=UPI003415AB06